MDKKQKSEYELTAQEMIDGLTEDMNNPESDPENREIVGAIFDQDEVTKFLEWLDPNRRQSK